MMTHARTVLPPRRRALAPVLGAVLVALATAAVGCGEPTPATGGGSYTGPQGGGGGGTDPNAGGGNQVTPGGDGNDAVAGGNQPNNVDPNLTQPTSSSSAAVRTLGRVAAASPQLTWPGSGIEASFQGTGGNFVFTPQQNVRLGLSIDGGNVVPQMLTGKTSVSFGNLQAGQHVVRAVLLSEGRLGTANFQGVTTNGNAVPPTPPTRRLAFIGDSITAAYGVDGTNPNCTNNASVEDATASFAALAAAQLQSDYALLAVAGKGVWRNDTSDAASNANFINNAGNANNPVTMQQIWTRQTVNDANSTYGFAPAEAPQGVVIALGTNDYEYLYTDPNGNPVQRTPVGPDATTLTPERQAFRNAYVALVQDVQTRWPGVVVLLCSSPLLDDNYPSTAEQQHTALLTDLQQIALTAGLPSANVLDLPLLSPAQRTGCGAHPNRSAHGTMAATLASKLTTVMQSAAGWGP